MEASARPRIIRLLEINNRFKLDINSEKSVKILAMACDSDVEIIEEPIKCKADLEIVDDDVMIIENMEEELSEEERLEQTKK